MAKSDTNNLRQNAGTARGTSNTLTQSGQSINATLTPTLARLANGGGGYTPQQTSRMTTAALQSIGGANSGVVGGGLQRAAATNNTGGANALALAAGHDATGQLSDAALGVQNESARLAAQQQAQALGEQGQLYSTDIGAANNALGLSTQATNAAEQASQNGFWRGVAGRVLNPATYAGYGQ
jgi:hypothetical protein